MKCVCTDKNPASILMQCHSILHFSPPVASHTVPARGKDVVNNTSPAVCVDSFIINNVCFSQHRTRRQCAAQREIINFCINNKILKFIVISSASTRHFVHASLDHYSNADRSQLNARNVLFLNAATALFLRAPICVANISRWYFLILCLYTRVISIPRRAPGRDECDA